jgi:hypothetical protein
VVVVETTTIGVMPRALATIWEGAMPLRNPVNDASPARLLEMLSDRFGAFEAVAHSSIKLARHAPEPELSMDLLVAEAVLEFGDDLRAARDAVTTRGSQSVSD